MQPIPSQQETTNKTLELLGAEANAGVWGEAHGLPDVAGLNLGSAMRDRKVANLGLLNFMSASLARRERSRMTPSVSGALGGATVEATAVDQDVGWSSE